MKKPAAAILLGLLLSTTMAAWRPAQAADVPGQTGTTAPARARTFNSRASAGATPSQLKINFELGAQMSMASSYNVGNVNQWFEQLTVPGEGMSDLAPGFMQFDARFMLSDKGNESYRAGLGLSYYKGSVHAFNAASAVTKTQFAATPSLYLMSLLFQLPLAKGSHAYVSLEPAMAIATMEGYFSAGTTRTTLAPTPGLGYQAGGGMDFYSGAFVTYARLGIRSVKANVGYTNAAGQAKQYVVPSTKALVVADMSGAYMTVGVGVKL